MYKDVYLKNKLKKKKIIKKVNDVTTLLIFMLLKLKFRTVPNKFFP